HQHIAAAAFPIEPGLQPPRRRQHLLPGLILLQAALNEACAERAEPLDGALGVVGDGAGEARLGVAAAAREDGVVERVGWGENRPAHDVDDAGRPTRAAWVAVFARPF